MAKIEYIHKSFRELNGKEVEKFEKEKQRIVSKLLFISQKLDPINIIIEITIDTTGEYINSYISGHSGIIDNTIIFEIKKLIV